MANYRTQCDQVVTKFHIINKIFDLESGRRWCGVRAYGRTYEQTYARKDRTDT